MREQKALWVANDDILISSSATKDARNAHQ